MKTNAIILAAGKGTRMKSKYPKVLHKILDKPMIMHVIDNLRGAGVENIYSIVGYEAEKVKEVVKDSSHYIFQLEQLGTAHALKMAKDELEDQDGITIVVCGDTPLITSETFQALIAHHLEHQNSATILTGILDDALAYGRIIRDGNEQVMKIVEFKDADENQKLVKEFNTGTYIFDNKILFDLIESIDNNNAQQEYYLTDIIELIYNQGLRVDGCVLKDLDETIGINDRVTLAYATELLQRKINTFHMLNGVTIIDPKNTYIGTDVSIEQDTIIQPGCHIYGDSNIGQDCIIGPETEIKDSTILANSKIIYSHIADSTIKNNVSVGPYARLRQNCIIEDGAKVGNFVEFKKTLFGKEAKSAHLSYLGDSIVGENVNIGCGTITVNYDGYKKHQTIIEDGAFIGCNSNLIAPVTIAEDAIIAAGTTVTSDVPRNSLAIGRVRPEIKDAYKNKFK